MNFNLQPHRKHTNSFYKDKYVYIANIKNHCLLSQSYEAHKCTVWAGHTIVDCQSKLYVCRLTAVPVQQ